MCICDEKLTKLQIIKYYFLYAIGYSIAISSKTIILGFMQPVSCIYKICDLSSFVFGHLVFDTICLASLAKLQQRDFSVP